MPEYRYKAKDSQGKIISSSVTADSKDDAIDKVCEFGYYPISVEDESILAKGKNISIKLFESRAMRTHVTGFARQLANLLKSGIPILRGIGIILEEINSAKFKIILGDIFRKIKDGKDLSTVLSGYPMLFDPFFVSMVRVGEENGTLPDILTSLVSYRRNQDEISAKIKGALVYPSIVGIVGIFSVAFIMTNVLPKIITLIKGMGLDLPEITVLLINITSFLQGYGFFILILIALGVFFLSKLCKTEKGSFAFDGLKLRLPILGRLIIESEFIKFARTLKTSLDGGLQLLSSMELATSVLNNEVVKKELLKCYDRVRSGTSLGACMKGSPIFPSTVSNMISVGEESGRLTGVLDQIAEDYEWRLAQTTKILMTVIEPMIILIIGSIVGFIVMALLLPIFSMDILAK